MEKKKSGLKIFLIVLLIVAIVGVFCYLVYINNRDKSVNSFNGEEISLNGITDYREYLVENQDDKTTYYTLKVYDAFYDNIDYMKRGGGVINLSSYLTSSELNEAINYITVATSGALTCLTFDNPELFWLAFDNLYICTETTGGFVNKIVEISFESRLSENVLTDFYASDFTSETQIDLYLQQMRQAREEIYRALDEEYPNGASDYETVAFFNDYLVDNIEYDELVGTKLESPLVHTAYGALVNGVAVCDGYAYAMQYLLDGKGITNLVGAGYIESNGEIGGHAWSYVNLYGNWYGLDVTWNDPVFEDPNVPEDIKEQVKHNYLLVGGDLASGTRFYSNRRTPQNYIYYFDDGESYYQFPIPKISTSNFVQPSIDNVESTMQNDGTVSISLSITGMMDNYKIYYAKSSDGISYGQYTEYEDVIVFDNVDDAIGSYKFIIKSVDDEIICEKESVISLTAQTSQNLQYFDENFSQKVTDIMTDEISKVA